MVFAQSAVTAFVFVATWLILKNYSFPGALKKAQNIVKPLILCHIYMGVIELDKAFAGGLTNPSLAISLSIWGSASYDTIVNDPVTGAKMTIW